MLDKAALEWIERSNAETLYHVERQARSSVGLIPFVGAGLSTAFGFRDWKGLLLEACPPKLVARVTGRLDRNDYEGAAEILLQALGADAFQATVAAAAGDRRLDTFDLTKGTVSLLPLLANGPVVTTNFDRILEHSFKANGASFESVVSGPRPDLIVDALHGNRRVLIKLHGDWQDRVGRTFARSDYDANYGVAQPERKRELLSGAERLLFSSRSLLFIGSSLGPDRTVDLLKEVHRDYAGVRHFAIMTAPASKSRLHEKEEHLRSCGVTPLWYVAESSSDHAERVNALLSQVVERASVRTVLDHPLGKYIPANPPKVPKVSLPQPVPRVLIAHLDRVQRMVQEGHLTFFLGSAVNWPSTLMAKEFYDELARVFECEALAEEPFAVAQYIADRYGRDTLDSEIKKIFARNKLDPQTTHALFAEWSKYQDAAGGPLPYPTIFTTNYDDTLEHTLREARLPFHLFTYQSSGPHKGLFLHQTASDAIRIVERPDNIRSLGPGFVIVKLNGGIDRRRRIPESFATTRLDYWDLAARIPAALPEVLRRTVTQNPLLILGHGLAAPDVESFIRFAHRQHPGPRSWAVVYKRKGVKYWQQCGVQILYRPVNLYIDELRRRLRAVPPSPVGKSKQKSAQ